MKKPNPKPEAQSDESKATAAHPGNVWADQASTRSGGSRVIDESHLVPPAAATPPEPEAALLPVPQSEEN